MILFAVGYSRSARWSIPISRRLRSVTQHVRHAGLIDSLADWAYRPSWRVVRPRTGLVESSPGSLRSLTTSGFITKLLLHQPGLSARFGGRKCGTGHALEAALPLVG